MLQRSSFANRTRCVTYLTPKHPDKSCHKTTLRLKTAGFINEVQLALDWEKCMLQRSSFANRTRDAPIVSSWPYNILSWKQRRNAVSPAAKRHLPCTLRRLQSPNACNPIRSLSQAASNAPVSQRSPALHGPPTGHQASRRAPQRMQPHLGP